MITLLAMFVLMIVAMAFAMPRAAPNHDRNERLSDLWWIRPKGRGHKYCAPIGMTLSMWVYRLQGKSAHWYSGSETSAIYFDGGSSLWQAPALLPKAATFREASFWNGRTGIRLRSRGYAFKH